MDKTTWSMGINLLRSLFKRTRFKVEGKIFKKWHGQTLSKKQIKAFPISNGMTIFISQKEYDDFGRKLLEFEKERERLQKELGKIMENSGSFASKTPGFNETEDSLKRINKRVAETKNFLNQVKTLKDLSELNQGEVTIYSLISCLDLSANKKIKYYIQHNLSDIKKDAVIITPFSPVGKSLMGKKTGDKVEVIIPRGNLKLKIISIEKKL